MNEKKPVIAIFITILLFSTIEVAVKVLGHGVIDSFYLAVIRFGIAGLLMVMIKLKELKSISKRDWFIIAGIGILGLGGTFGPYHYLLHKPTNTASEIAVASI